MFYNPTKLPSLYSTFHQCENTFFYWLEIFFEVVLNVYFIYEEFNINLLGHLISKNYLTFTSCNRYRWLSILHPFELFCLKYIGLKISQ